MNLPLTEIAVASLTGLFIVLWWFYRQRDQDNKNAIALLFKKHDEDVDQLNELKLQIASKHYERTDLDAKFDRMEATFKIGFNELGFKFDKLSDVLTKHMVDTNHVTGK